jgi:hypothetical protein
MCSATEADREMPRTIARTITTLPTLIATLALAACGPGPRGVWTKEGVTESELKRDQRACTLEAGSYDFLVPPPTLGGGPAVAARQQADIYRACMASKGYGEVPAGSVTKQPGQPSP